MNMPTEKVVSRTAKRMRREHWQRQLERACAFAVEAPQEALAIAATRSSVVHIAHVAITRRAALGSAAVLLRG